MVYDYDLISGKVNQVAYQPGLKDEFYHRYNYDAENRLVEAYTSHDKLIWEKDARYSYYRHGPLARTNLGQQQVQGIDYAYTLQGWLKGINSTAVQQPDLITGSGEDCGPGSAVENLLVSARLNPLPLQYVARAGITFDPGFESTGNDDFTAYIDNSLISCGPNGTAGTVPAALPGNMFDIGQDGVPGADGTPSQVAKDVYGFGLNYFTGDYKPIGKVIPFGTFTAPSPSTTGGSLFNGNISSMAVNIPKLGQPYLYGYRYDQLNRIVAMDAFTGGTTNNSQWGLTATQNYKERISYDANGNILTYNRSGNTGNHNMDSLTYKYPTFENTPANIQAGVVGKMINNRLRYVHDAYSTPALTEDIESQTTLSLAAVQAQQLPAQAGDNFAYDEIGNLIKDTTEGIDNITWNVYGKILSITKDGNTISYSYDASGNRISKTASGKKSIYVRDASGNVMSVYSTDQAVSSGNLIQDEVHLYGSSRLGIFDVNRNVQLLGEADYLNNINTFARGNKFFELSNHLGNVLVTVSDKKIPVSANGTTIDYYNADVVTANDYAPFGSLLTGRNYNAPGAKDARFGFNGKENDNEVKGEGNQQDYGFRIYDPRLGKFLSVDPITKEYPELTPYQFASNKPIAGVDLDGLEFKSSIKNGVLYISVKLTVVNYNDVVSETQAKTIGDGMKFDFSERFSKPSQVVNIGGIQIMFPQIIATADIETVNTKGADVATNKKLTELQNSINLGGSGIIVNLKDLQVAEDAETAVGGSTPKTMFPSQNNALTYNVSQNGILRENDAIKRTSSHELGHAGGLQHTWDETNFKNLKQSTRKEQNTNRKSILDNLMNSQANPSSRLKSTSGRNLQYGQILKLFLNVQTEQKEYGKKIVDAVKVVISSL